MVSLQMVVGLTLLFGGANELRRRAPQLRTNPLAWFAPLILITLGARGIMTSWHLLRSPNGPIERADFGFLVVPNLIAFALIVGYVCLRLYYVRALAIDIGTYDYPDQVEAARRAALIQDKVVQELAAARWSIEVNEPEEALSAIEKAFSQTQAIVTERMTSGKKRPRIRPTTAGTGGASRGG